MKRKLTGILTKFVILALALYAGISLVRLIGRIDGALAAKRELEAQVQETEIENEKLRRDIENSDNDGVIGNYAREKLGLAYEDEIVFYGD